MEAAVIAAAVSAKRAGNTPEGPEAPPAAGTRSRKGDLQAETAWLLLVAHAYDRQHSRATTAEQPSRTKAGAAS